MVVSSPPPPPLTCGEEVEVGVRAQHPEAVVVPPEGLDARPLGHVPHADALVLRVGQDELLARVEDGAGHIVVVAAARVQLPGLGLCGSGGARLALAWTSRVDGTALR